MLRGPHRNSLVTSGQNRRARQHGHLPPLSWDTSNYEHAVAVLEQSHLKHGSRPNESDAASHQQRIDRTIGRLISNAFSDERREDARVLFLQPVWLFYDVYNNDQHDKRSIDNFDFSVAGIKAVTTDISTGGAGLIVESEIRSRSLVIQFPTITVSADLCWTRSITPRLFRAGVRFINVIREIETESDHSRPDS